MKSLDEQKSELNPEESQPTGSKGEDGSEPARLSRMERRDIESSVKSRRRVIPKKLSAELASGKFDAPVKDKSRD